MFQEHWERVCEVLFRLVGDWAEAEDLAIETFMRLYQSPPRDSTQLGGWLYRVATNLGLNALRARDRRRGYEQEAGVVYAEENQAQNPAHLVEQAQEKAHVRETLARMKPRAAKLLILRHSGLSYAEIAVALRVSPGSVGTLLARAEQEFIKKHRI